MRQELVLVLVRVVERVEGGPDQRARGASLGSAPRVEFEIEGLEDCVRSAPLLFHELRVVDRRAEVLE